jgi:hypothetical protein
VTASSRPASILPGKLLLFNHDVGGGASSFVCGGGGAVHEVAGTTEVRRANVVVGIGGVLPPGQGTRAVFVAAVLVADVRP